MKIFDGMLIFADNDETNEWTLDRMILDWIDDVFWENNYYYLNGDVCAFCVYYQNLYHLMMVH